MRVRKCLLICGRRVSPAIRKAVLPMQERERRARVKLQAVLKALEKQHEPARQEIVPPEPLKRLPDAPGASSGIGQYYAGRCETKICPHCKVDRVHCGHHDEEWWRRHFRRIAHSIPQPSWRKP